ncbi:MAG TPA: FeoC-like transcriptional regulator [Propionicimonas sp.]|jgi:FeoC like transcriptional regulator|nr:FeoC-like transcriptional regulator [Propionicimonas sp.]
MSGARVLTPLTIAPATPTAGPLSAVLAELSAGTATVVEMSRHTGLTEGLIRTALDHLVRTGRVASQELPIGCPPTGCGGCSAAGGCSVAT